jgi:hypothetical protein
VPPPAPLDAPVTVSHGALDTAVHPQSVDVARNVTDPFPAPAPTPVLEIDNAIAQVWSEYAAVAAHPVESTAAAVNFPVPAAVGVPDRTPAVLSVTPGTPFAVMVKRYEPAPPEADSVCEYACPSVAGGSVAGVNAIAGHDASWKPAGAVPPAPIVTATRAADAPAVKPVTDGRNPATGLTSTSY